MRSTRLQFTHALAAAVGVAMLAGASIATALSWSEFPAPFFWLDIAVVYFLAALPLAASLAAAVWQPNFLPTGYFSLLALELAALLFVPQLYVHAHTQADTARLSELIRQSRFGEASQLIHRTTSLAPHANSNGQPLFKLAANIDQTIARLEAAVAHPLAAEASDQQRLQRAELLAMLGRTNQALAVLGSSPTLASNADACNLHGTVHETHRQWQLACHWYELGKSAPQQTDDSSAKTAGLARSLQGIAFCNRKLGRLREAEKAWLELLALAPSANTHFLLAQFYEDTQQTAKSRLHATEALKLDPEHYRDSAKKLLDNLVTSHFGCLGVFQPAEALAR